MEDTIVIVFYLAQSTDVQGYASGYNNNGEIFMQCFASLQANACSKLSYNDIQTYLRKFCTVLGHLSTNKSRTMSPLEVSSITDMCTITP